MACLVCLFGGVCVVGCFLSWFVWVTHMWASQTLRDRLAAIHALPEQEQQEYYLPEIETATQLVKILSA